MGLSPQDIEYLEELSEMYRLGHLSDAAFKHATNLVMTKHAKALAPSTPKPKPKPADSVTSTRPRLTAVREPSVLSPSSARESANRSAKPDESAKENVKAAQSAKRKRITATVSDSNPPSTSHNVFSMKNTKSINKMSLVSTLLTVLVAAGISLTTSESAPFTRLLDGADHADAAAISPAPTSENVPLLGEIIDPLFGPTAVASCQKRCQSKNDKTAGLCATGCQKLALTEYGRRVTLRELDPGRDANVIYSRCSNQPIKSSGQPRTDWQESVHAASRLVAQTQTAPGQTSYGGARLLFSNFVEARENVTIARNANFDDRELAETLAQATCLHAHLALTELASIIAAENSDTFSRRFYQRLHQSLRGKLDPVRTKVARQLER